MIGIASIFPFPRLDLPPRFGFSNAMTTPELLAKLAHVMQTTPDQLRLDAGPATLPGWDSMSSLGIISLLDDAGIHDITAEDASRFTTIGEIVSFARARGVLKD